MLDETTANDVRSTKDAARLLQGPLFFASRYKNWSNEAASWSNALAGINGSPPADQLKALIEMIRHGAEVSGLFQGLVGMAWRRAIDVSPDRAGCGSANLGLVDEGVARNQFRMSFDKFQIALVQADEDPMRIAAAKQVAHLVEFACIAGLQKALHDASAEFRDEADRMIRYVSLWNTILKDKRPALARITISLANVGRYDSFVRSEGKVAVGPKGLAKPLTFTVHRIANKDDDETEASGDVGYIKIPSRANVVIVFQADLDTNIREQLYGAYQSQLAFLKLGLVASAGSVESDVVSQAAPFSREAKIEFRKRVDDIALSL
jgi:hypothetical protein